MRIRLTDNALEVVRSVRALEDKHAATLAEQGLAAEELEATGRSLRHVERVWDDYIHYSGRR